MSSFFRIAFKRLTRNMQASQPASQSTITRSRGPQSPDASLLTSYDASTVVLLSPRPDELFRKIGGLCGSLFRN